VSHPRNLLGNTQESVSYDDFGDLIQISNNDVIYSYTYTPRHELASKTDSRLKGN
jgi:YD repeat-containing protein